MAIFLLVLKIIGIVLLCLLGLALLLLFTPVSVAVSYRRELSVRLRVFFLSFTLYPEKEKKKNKKPSVADAHEKEKKPFSLDAIGRFIEPVRGAAGFLLRKIRINRIEAVIPVTASDPAQLAIKYGKIQAVGGMVLAFMQNTFIINIKEYSVIPDFDSAHADSERYACVISAVPLTLGVAALIFFSRYNSATTANTKENMNGQR